MPAVARATDVYGVSPLAWRGLPPLADPVQRDVYLRSLYYDTNKSAAYGTASSLYRAVRKDGKHRISHASVKEWLNDQNAYAFYRKASRRFPRERVVVSEKHQQWDCDTLSMGYYRKQNQDYAFILVCIDVFTRWLITRPLKTLKAAETRLAFQDILKTVQKPDSIRTDRGGEFVGSEMKKYLLSEGIKHVLTNNELKSSYAERVNRTLRSRIARLIRGTNRYDWLTHLEKLTEAYNYTKHRSIAVTPAAALCETSSYDLWQRQYLASDSKTGKFDEKFALEVGDRVRASYLTGPFHRNHDENWTKEIFTVTHKRLSQGFQKYRLKSADDTSIEGEFYQEELLKTKDGGEHYEYEVDEILHRRTVGRGRNKRTDLFVSWVGWPKKYNKWVPENVLVDVL